MEKKENNIIDFSKFLNRNKKHLEFWHTKDKLILYLENGVVLEKRTSDKFRVKEPIIINNEECFIVEGYWLNKGMQIELAGKFYTIEYIESDRIVLFYGAAGSGKSYSVANKILLLPFIFNSSFKVLVIRKTYDRLRDSCISLIQKRAEEMFPYDEKGNNMFFKFSDETGKKKACRYGPGLKSEILFKSMHLEDDFSKVKSISDVDLIWCEEADELDRSAFMENIIQRLRGGNPLFKQCILTFNPKYKSNWIYKDFFERNTLPNKKIKVLPYDTDFPDNENIARMSQYKTYNYSAYLSYYLAEFQDVSGELFRKNDLSFYDYNRLTDSGEDIVSYVDLGFTVDKTVMVVGKQKFEDGLIYITNVFRFNGTTDEVIEKVANVCINYNISRLGIESNFRQNEDADKIEKILREKNYKGIVDKIRNTIKKEHRIMLIQPIVKQYVRFRRDYEEIDDYRDFMNNLFSYGSETRKNQNDDDADALEGFVSKMCNNYGVPRNTIYNDNNFEYENNFSIFNSIKTEVF